MKTNSIWCLAKYVSNLRISLVVSDGMILAIPPLIIIVYNCLQATKYIGAVIPATVILFSSKMNSSAGGILKVAKVSITPLGVPVLPDV